MDNDAATPAIRPNRLVALVSTFIAILYIVFIIRYFVLRRLRASGAPRILLPDFTLGAGLLLFTVQGALTIWTAKRRHFDIDHPSDDWIPELGMSISDATQLQKIVVTTNFLYISALWLIKASFALYYYDFHSYLSKRLQIFLFAITGFIALTYAASMVLTAEWCSPVSRTWSFGQHNFCTPINSVLLISFTAWTSIVIDFLLIIFPLYVLRTLRLRGLQQCAVGVLPSMTSLTSVTAIIRFAFLIHDRNRNLSFKYTQQWQVASTVEVFVGIFAACHPALRALVRRAWRVNYGGSSKGSSRRNLLPMHISEGTDREVLVVEDKPLVLVTKEELERFRYA